MNEELMKELIKTIADGFHDSPATIIALVISSTALVFTFITVILSVYNVRKENKARKVDTLSKIVETRRAMFVEILNCEELKKFFLKENKEPKDIENYIKNYKSKNNDSWDSKNLLATFWINFAYVAYNYNKNKLIDYKIWEEIRAEIAEIFSKDFVIERAVDTKLIGYVDDFKSFICDLIPEYNLILNEEKQKENSSSNSI